MNWWVGALASFVTSVCLDCASEQPHPNTKDGIRIVKAGLTMPWEIVWSKDNQIWMTERAGTILRIDPASGAINFSYAIKEVISRGEGGLLGLALHPHFDKNGFLYVVYNYTSAGGYKEKLVRFTFANNTLSQPAVLLDGIAAAGIHNGSRIWITNETSPKIFLSTGDASNQSLPQKTNNLNGKILRLNIDGSIPADNPFPNSPVWSYGHRNAQGLVMVNNIMYASEHGPSVEDEVNIIEQARNYGWPDVLGPCDDGEIAFCTRQRVKEPIWSSGDMTLAVCGLDYYGSSQILQWKNSLLMTTLKNASLRQLKLSADGSRITGTTTWFKDEWGRLRDLCISPDGKVYVCTSNGRDDMLIEIAKL